jgi:hypothetical protein
MLSHIRRSIDRYVSFSEPLVNDKVDEYVYSSTFLAGEGSMDVAATERELIERMKRFVKAELKRADLTYEELADRLREHGFAETKGSVAAKINRGSFPATFFVAVMKAVGRENVNLADV